MASQDEILRQHSQTTKWASLPPEVAVAEAKRKAYEKLGNDSEALGPIVEVITRFEQSTRASQGAGMTTPSGV